jgi:hypothetical protein
VVRGFSPLVIEGRLDGLAGFPADGFVGFRVGAGIFGGQGSGHGIEAREEFVGVFEEFSVRFYILFPHAGWEFGHEALEEFAFATEADEAATAVGVLPGELEEDGGSSRNLGIRMGDEGLESGLVLGRDVGLVEHTAEFFQEVDLLADSPREAGAVLADMIAMSLAAEAFVGTDPLADVAEATHRRGGDSGFQIQV